MIFFIWSDTEFAPPNMFLDWRENETSTRGGWVEFHDPKMWTKSWAGQYSQRPFAEMKLKYSCRVICRPKAARLLKKHGFDLEMPK